MATFVPGSLVSARQRDWVVVSWRDNDLCLLRPINGVSDLPTGILLPLEPDVREAAYPPPPTEAPGDLGSALLLRDAARTALRSGAGPFRSLSRLSVTPRPYQFVPLLMALRLDPVRLLIADDVGIGKTIEAAMIARELLDRGLIRRIGVVCPPHLCDQWQQELADKFGIEAAVVQPSRMAHLQRGLPRQDLSIYQYYPHLVASIDYVKTDRNRRAFIDNAPDFLIVDEAHGASRPRGDESGRQQERYALVRDLAADQQRHLVLVTATPHSGIEESFRSLLGLLKSEFDRPEAELDRRALVPHIVQRRRADVAHQLGDITPFPQRLPPVERPYSLSAAYHRLFNDILAYCQESVEAPGLDQRHQRVRYWAALAILRCVLSSPAAAETMLEKRRREPSGGAAADSANPELENQLFDAGDDEEPGDYVPAAALDAGEAALSDSELQRLDRFLLQARRLAGPEQDQKVAEVITVARELLAEGYNPIIFCRFIATATYVAEHLRRALAHEWPGLEVKAITGDSGSSEQRKEQVAQLAQAGRRILVATECLSEGVNLQESFDAVVHYDLPWNPNRLEQREGRVDRYGQKSRQVKAVLLYGADNPIDLTVLEVLIRKVNTIRTALGVSVPVPVDTDKVVEAMVQNVLFRGRRSVGPQLTLALTLPEVQAFHQQLDASAQREQQSRAFFSQQGIKPEEVARELAEMEPVLGSPQDLSRFLADALSRFNGALTPATPSGTFRLHPGDLRNRLEDRAPNLRFPLHVCFEGVAPAGVLLLGRTHPVVETITEAVLGEALAGRDPAFARCGAVFTHAVTRRTAVLTLRIRYLLEERGLQHFAEEVVTAAFQRGADGALQWLDPQAGLQLLSTAQPAADMPPAERKQHLDWALGMLTDGWHRPLVQARTGALQQSHQRLRALVNAASLTVRPHEPPDILGCYVLVPAGGHR